MKNRIFALFLSLIVFITLACALTACSPDDNDPDTDDSDDGENDTPTYYTVSFDTDGVGTVPSQSVENGKKATAPTSPTKTGYTFGGWHYLGEKWDFDTDTVSGAITLTAVWTPIEYKAVFYADGISVDTVIFTVEDDTLSSIPSVPIKNGYTGAWEPYTLGTQDIAVNATYSLVTYTVTYNNLNGAANSNPATYTFVSPTISLNDLTSADSVFDGWYDTSGARVTEIPSGSFGNIILTARWSRKLTVTFNTNGADTATPSQQLAPSGTIISKPVDPTKQHYDFTGWYNGNKLWDFETDLVTSDVTLIAKWVPTKYTASFYADGRLIEAVQFTVEDNSLSYIPTVPNKNGYTGVWEAYTLEAKDITVNALYSLVTYTITYSNLNGAVNNNPTTYTVNSATISLNPLTSETSVFKGWYNVNNQLVTSIPSGSYGNISLTAKWTGKFNVIFDSDGGSIVSSQLVLSGEKATVPDAPIRAGYTFAGWYNGNTEWSFENDAVTADITLKAKWQIITYIITYNGLSGASNTGNPTSYTIESSTIVFLAPTLDGYTFDGWKDESEALVTQLPTGSYGNITLTASWSFYTVTTSTNLGGAGEYTEHDNVKTAVGTQVSLTATVNIGYTFLGWYNENDKVTNQLTYTFDMPKANVAFVAKYELDASMTGFEFTSTPTECVITGYTDKTVTSLGIPAYVTKIQANSFKGCISLSAVTVKSTSTVIEEKAFWGCIYLTEITVGSTTVPIKTYYTFEEYRGMSGAEQEAYYNSFLTVSDFYKWFNKAKEEYEASQNREVISGNGDVNLGE